MERRWEKIKKENTITAMLMHRQESWRYPSSSSYNCEALKRCMQMRRLQASYPPTSSLTRTQVLLQITDKHIGHINSL
eukprot:scaffold224_cov108-Skeletonema_marinoi.AAC.26